MKRAGQKNANSLLILILNVLLLACAALLYGRYTAIYQERLREENLGNIANLNQFAATNATALINSWDTKLDDISQYIERHQLTHDEALCLIDDANSSPDRQFELIGGDYTGYLAKRDENGAFPPVTYQNSAYAELKAIIDDANDASHGDICFAPEFTNSVTALKHFAIYAHLPLQNEAGATEVYTLLLSSKSKDVLAVFNNQNVFAGLSSVLVDEKGNYIVSSNDFKSDNFFQYLYVYNDLTLDQRSEITREMTGRESGELYYLNGSGEECVFRYAKMPANNWYCITCVPLSSFRTPVISAHYAMYAVIALVAMLGIDIFWLRSLNRRMRISMLREKEASEAKTDFLSRMSHDIRTPLNGIIGMTLLARDEANPPNTAEYLDNIKASGDFLLGLVNDILDMSKVESGKMELHPEPYSSYEFRKYIEAVIAPLCRDKEQSFRVACPEGNLTVMFDRLRLNQIFFNLLSNAVKYTQSGGQVELEWTRTLLEDGRVNLDFTVRDNGIGMSEEFQKRMFESFSQEHAEMAIPGSGLGLSIVWNLVNLMGGQIDVCSREGEGSTFVVHLQTQICQVQEQPTPSVDETSLEGRRALLCEDNQINAIIAKKLLEKWGVSVDIAENGRIGLEKFSAAAPGTYDVILMDIRMPEMNGLDATRAIRALNRADAATIPIVAMTANAYDSDVKNCLDAGMNAHAGKPIQPDQIRALLVEMITRSAL